MTAILTGALDVLGVMGAFDVFAFLGTLSFPFAFLGTLSFLGTLLGTLSYRERLVVLRPMMNVFRSEAL